MSVRSHLPLLILSLSLALAACGGSTTGTSGTTSSSGSSSSGSSSSASDTSCPSYASEVAVVLDSYCTSCHGPGGSESNRPLTTYASASSYASQIKTEVSSGRMPQGGSMASADETTLLSWVNCGAPNN